MNEIQTPESKKAPHIYDQIIIGGGPAGLTAAVYSARKKLDVLLLTEDIGGQVLWTSEIENYMGFQFVSGMELIEKFKQQVQQFPIAIETENGAAALSKKDGVFSVATRKGDVFSAHTLIIASGKRSRLLGVPGESEFRGRGVSFCSTCDGPFFRNLDVAVIGGGNSGITTVVDMANLAKKVYSINVLDTLQADPVLIDRARAASNVEFLLGYEVLEIKGDSLVTGIVVRNKATGETRALAVEGVFIEIGLQPNTDFIGGFVQLNEHGEVRVDCSSRTTVDGVFAAGDVTNVPDKQIIIAAGEGAKAALGAYNYLIRR